MKSSVVAWWWLLYSYKKPNLLYTGKTTTDASGNRFIVDEGKDKAPLALTHGQGLDFDGVGDYVPIDVTLDTEFTIRLDGVSTNYCIGDSSWSSFISFNYEGTEDTLRVKINLVTYLFSYYSPAIETYYICASNTTISLYVNGVHIEDIERTDDLSTVELYYLMRQSTTYGAGTLGNVQFWNTAFTPEQVAYDFNYPEKALYIDSNESLASYNTGIDVADCVAWIPLTEGQGQYVRDMVSYGEGANVYTSVNGVDSSITKTAISGGFNITTAAASASAYMIFNTTGIISGDWVLIEFIAAINSGSTAITNWYDGTLKYTIPDVQIVNGYNALIIGGKNTNQTVWYFDEASAFDVDFTNFTVKKLSGTYKLPHTDPDTVAWPNGYGGSTGIQTSLIKRDILWKLIGLADGYEMTGQVPAIPIDLTDTKLNSGEGFVISIIIDRDTLATDAYLLDTLSSLTGLTLNLNKNGDEVELLLFDGASSAGVSTVIDEDLNGIIFEVTSTNVTMIVDGVAGTPITHSFVPSGLNFKDSTKASPIGQLPYFAMWYGDNYDKYDREKEIIAHNIAINEYYALFSIEGDDILVTEDGYALAYLN